MEQGDQWSVKRSQLLHGNPIHTRQEGQLDVLMGKGGDDRDLVLLEGRDERELLERWKQCMPFLHT